jgi:cytochrome c biogenesis protein CcdA
LDPIQPRVLDAQAGAYGLVAFGLGMVVGAAWRPAAGRLVSQNSAAAGAASRVGGALLEAYYDYIFVEATVSAPLA